MMWTQNRNCFVLFWLLYHNMDDELCIQIVWSVMDKTINTTTVATVVKDWLCVGH